MKHMVLVLAAVLSLAAAASAAGPRLEVRVPDGPAAAGETFQVDTRISGNEGFRSLQFVLTYDADRLECTAVKGGTLIRNAMWAGNPASDKGAAFAAAASNAIEGDGQTAVFTFRARTDLAEIDIRPVELYVFGAGNLDGIQLPASAAILPVPRSDAAVTTPGQGGASSGPTAPASGGKPVSSSHAAESSSEVLPSSDRQFPSSEALPSSDRQFPSSEALPSSDALFPSSETLPSSKTAPVSGQTTSPSGGQGGQGATQSGGQGATQTGKAESGPAPFTDTAGTWAERDIAEASRRGLFHGYPDGSFRPNNVITRGQYVLVLWNLAGRPAPTKTPPFRDLDSLSAEFRDAVAWAWENGYVNGTAPDRFSSGGYLTRQAAMKILYGFNGGESGAELMFTDAYDSVYQDSGKLSAWAREGVYWAVYHSILRGVTSTMLNPSGVLTRAQLAAVMIRYTDRFPASGPTA